MSTEEEKSKEIAHLIEHIDREGIPEQASGAGKSLVGRSADAAAQSEADKSTVTYKSAAEGQIATERPGFADEQDIEKELEQHKAPGQPKAEQPSPDQTGPEKLVPEKSRAEQPSPEQHSPDQTGPEQTRPEQLVSVQPGTEKPGQGHVEPDRTEALQFEPEQPEPEQPGPEQTTSIEQSEAQQPVAKNFTAELPEAAKTVEEQPTIYQSVGVQDKAELARADLQIPSYLSPDVQALAEASVSHPGSSLSLLADIADYQSAQTWRSEPIPSTSGYFSHPSHLPDTNEIDEATFLLKLERTFNEAELFYSDVSSLGGSPIPFNPREDSDGEPAAKRRREQLPKATFSSFDETTSSSSSSRHSPLLPSTISGLEDSPPHKLDINLGTTKFWKYRQIPKGPEGRTFNPQVQSPTDPTKPLEFRDPVFMETETAEGLTHFGKARTGEANDITPQPAKLAHIGNIVRDIGKRMENMKDKSQEKEKAKLSSNHCRLRKIANNEANKIIFNGMEKEKGELTITLSRVREAIGSHELPEDEQSASLVSKVNTIMTECYHTRVAGQAGVYIDHILAEHGYTSE